jgi:hypothetical protein
MAQSGTLLSSGLGMGYFEHMLRIGLEEGQFIGITDLHVV